MNKHVAIIGTRGYPSYYGGFETAVRKLAPFLVEMGWKTTVYGRSNSTKKNDPTIHDGVETIETFGIDTKSLSTLSYGFSACISAARRKPDVALIMNVANGYFLPLLKARGIRTVVNVDGIEWDRQKWGKAAKAVFRLGARFTARYADELIFDAEAIAKRWKSEFNRDGTVIPYGGEERQNLPVENGLPARGYVLLVARFVPENTIAEFFEAVPALSQRWPVVLVGSSGYGGQFDARAMELASQEPNVHWLGHISDDERLFSLWEHAGVYFHGHSVGGTNPTLVQAMALGSPVVARDTVYNREVLGPAGVFCAPSSSDIEEQVVALMEDRKRQDRISDFNRDRAEKNYNWKAVNRAYADLLDYTLSRMPSTPARASQIS